MTTAFRKKKFAIAYAKSGNAGQSAMEVYNYKNMASAREAGARMLHDPEVQNTIGDVLRKAGLTEENAVGKLKEILEATRPVVSNKRIHNLPDYPTQHDAVKTVLKLHGHLSTRVDMSTNIDSRQQNLHLTADVDKLKGLVLRLDSIDRRLKFHAAGLDSAQVDAPDGEVEGAVDPVDIRETEDEPADT